MSENGQQGWNNGFSGYSVLFALSTGTRIVLPHTTTGNVGHCGMLPYGHHTSMYDLGNNIVHVHVLVCIGMSPISTTHGSSILAVGMNPTR